MAEGGTQNVLCRYFMNGVCREGERCHFSHSCESRPSMICRYNLKGYCYYGRNCRYDHTRPGTSSDLPEPVTFPTHNPDGDTKHRNHTQEVNAQSSHPNTLKINKQDKNLDPTSQSGLPTTTSLRNSCTSSSNSITTSSSLPGLRNKPTNLESSSHKSQTQFRVDAPEFVPKFAKDNIYKQYEVSYAQVAGAGDKESTRSDGSNGGGGGLGTSDSELCPTYLMSGRCQLGEHCSYIHGLMCEVCQLACLHPYDKEQRRIHKEECSKLMEAEMEHSFAVARSKDKVCGICMETIMERPLASQRRFGILPNCCHCFCLSCIRKWRQSKQYENKVVRSCPECRTQSDFVIPSRYWVDNKDKEEKSKLLDSYQTALSDKPCKYFKQGEGQCPFGNKCFYLHALPDGTKKDVGPPRQRRRFNADGELQVYLDNMVLWDFIEEREHRLELLRGSIQTLLLELELEDLADQLYFPEDSLSETADL
ncbi:hypothetical protein Pmani_000282 [Petrolisthes manimaculis]|uniref:RING-type E3 ubiquitin transferase n=1 Tax=Petrolisthes manimaculis TaxID=1843537 RepID=A0AAE1UT60_9EUCA|nr:hypothetical protein Pmani_000282 [Petrolisthes manimaculis]